jgi:hypothetical protein
LREVLLSMGDAADLRMGIDSCIRCSLLSRQWINCVVIEMKLSRLVYFGSNILGFMLLFDL